MRLDHIINGVSMMIGVGRPREGTNGINWREFERVN